MAHLVKTKASIASLSILAIVLVSAMQASFYHPSTIKRWDEKNQLSWSDFKGFPVPFSRYGAGIASKVYLEHDSLNRMYVAYAGQNNMRSWTKFDDENLLRHEQYHFNNTELFARKLNKYLSEEDGLTPAEIEEKLIAINAELSLFQDKYDSDTDHSLKVAKQLYWEFKIDSSLQEYTSKKGIVTDYLSGISARFYKTPDFSSGLNDAGVACRVYGLTSYNMGFTIGSYKFAELPEKGVMDLCGNINVGDDTKVLERTFHTTDDYSYCEAVMINSAHTKMSWERYYQYGNDAYYAKVAAPYDSLNKEYEKIKNSFFNSISFSDTRDYWIQKAEPSNTTSNFTKSANIITADNKEGTDICVGADADNIFLMPPFFDEDHNLYIVYDIVAHPESDVLDNIVLLNRQDLFDWQVDSTAQLLVLPKSLLPETTLELEIGYTLKKDSLEKCYQLYKQSGMVNLK